MDERGGKREQEGGADIYWEGGEESERKREIDRKGEREQEGEEYIGGGRGEERKRTREQKEGGEMYSGCTSKQ